jgi:hypothetical protein
MKHHLSLPDVCDLFFDIEESASTDHAPEPTIRRKTIPVSIAKSVLASLTTN